MALSSSKVTNSVMNKLRSNGFATDNNHAKQEEMVKAIVEALIESIQSDAQVIVASGSSAGTYKVS